MERFGYTRTVDVPTYERNKDAADLESKYVVSCLNTGKVCMFTNTGKMHQVKVLDIPFGKFRDKGTPIDNMSNFNSAEEEILFICDENQFRIATLLFATKQGMVKKVSGEEFLVGKRTIAATKLNDGDELINVHIINPKHNVVIQTQNGYFLRFHGSEISEMKKTAAGVRGIKLQKNDVVEQVYLYTEGVETKVIYKEKELTLNRLKQSSRGGQGTKSRV
jgi:DNA gyrase subunit A